MSEEDILPGSMGPPAKRGPGRPRKNPEPKVEVKAASKAYPKMEAAPNWVTVDPSSEENPDRLHIDKSDFPDGMDLQWVRAEVYGQADPHWRARREAQGWTPWSQKDDNGRYNGRWMRKDAPGEINVDGLVLMARPMEMTLRARERDRRAAREQVLIKEQALRGGDLPVSLDSRHPSAVNTNRIGKSYERISVPEE